MSAGGEFVSTVPPVTFATATSSVGSNSFAFLTTRPTSAIAVIRDAVGEMETAWTQRLGPERFAQLRGLLLELTQLA